MIKMIKKQLRTNRRGFVLPLITTLVVLLSIAGVALLGLGMGARLQASRTTAEISARAAADAGFTKAIFEMNKNLSVKPWRFKNIASSDNRVLLETNANYTYTIEEITKDSEYRIIAIGRSGQATKTASATIGRLGLFDYAIFATGYAQPKHPKHSKKSGRPKPLKKGGKVEIERYDVDGYSSDPDNTYSGSLQFRTNSNHKKSVKLKDNVTINGDVVVGPGGNPDKVIEMKSSARITGDTYAAAERWEPPPVILPTGLENRKAKKYKYKDDKPITGTVKYTEFKMPEEGVQEIVGDVTIYVEGDMKIEKGAELIITEGSSLTLYIGNKFETKRDKGGNTKGITNETEDPTKLIIYGTDTCRKIKIEENQGVFYGAVYAPYAKVEIKNIDNVYGAFVGWDVKLKKGKKDGKGDFYYDEALHSTYYAEAMGSDDPLHFVIKTWREQ